MMADHKETYEMLSPDVSTWAKTVAVILVSTVSLLCISQVRHNFVRIKSRFSGRRLPPGPTPWPLLGSLPSIMLEPHDTLVRMARKYGPVMSFQMGMKPAVIISSSTMAQEILKTHDRIFGFRPSSLSYQILSPTGYTSFNESGEKWKQDRKLFNIEVTHAKRLKHTKNSDGRSEEILLALRSLVESAKKNRSGIEIDSEFLSKYFFHVVGNILTRMLFGERLFTSNSSSLHDLNSGTPFSDSVTELFQVTSTYDLRDLFPFLKGFDPQSNSKRMKAAAEDVNKMLQPLLDARRQALKLHNESNADGGDQSYLDVLLSDVDQSTGKPVSDNTIKDLAKVIITVGTHTTAGIIHWAIRELLRKPEYLKRCQKELDDVVGRDRLVSEADLPNLPFVRAIILETMRLHPVAAFLVARESIRDCDVGGYFIPAKTLTLVNVQAINRDPLTWSSPEEFIPDRHFKSQNGGDVDLNTEDFTLLTFGSGRRVCPGRRLAWLTTQIILATFLHTLDLNPLTEASNWSKNSHSEFPGDSTSIIPTLRVPHPLVFPEIGNGH